jgi:hypothetical protein
VVVIGILDPEMDVCGEWRGEAYDAPRAGLRAGDPACETREVKPDLTRGAVLNAARDAGREVFAGMERRAEEEEVGMLYLATPALLCVFDGVGVAGGGGTTTQFFANSFSLGVGLLL